MTELLLTWFLVMFVEGSDFGVIMEKYDGWKDRGGCEAQKVMQIVVAKNVEMKEKIPPTSYICVALPKKLKA